ncbi:MAG TPA: serine/threonine-protein kinase, partial [Humisphaera sp.]
MSDDPRILELLHAAVSSDATPDDVCAADPDLLPEVRRRWEHCRRVGAELDALFPSTVGCGALRGDDGEAPRIAGYEVSGVLGRGGMGVVYRARHLRLGRDVALKMLLPGAYAGTTERARFLREAKAVAALRHPHVVQVYDVGECDGRPYFTMELAEGGTLAARLSGAPQPPAAAAAAVAAVADAVESAHAAGIVHRDLKPANVLLAGDGTPKVSDFGLAHLSGDGDGGPALTQSGARLGTPSYMAPEQAAGRLSAVGPATDVYALGAILYEMLTGRPPFRGESAAETERQVLADDPVPPSRLRPRLPRDVETVCLKCLAKDPGRRYPSSAALADDLRRFGRGEPVQARRTGLAGRAARWVRRRPAAAAAFAATTALALAIAGGSLWVLADRAAVRRAAEADLAQVAAAHRRGDWDGAGAALDRAAVRL